MAKVIKTLAVEDGLDFDNITYFETEKYVGVWSFSKSKFILIKRSNDTDFNPMDIDNCTNLQELDDEVFRLCEEHIIEVYNCYAGYSITFRY